MTPASPSPLRAWWIRTVLRSFQRLDRFRLWRLGRRHPGLEVHPGASTNFAAARFELGPGARLSIAEGAVTDRRREGVSFLLGPGAEVRVGSGTWLRSEIGLVHIVAFEGAVIEIGPDCLLNACHLSAKERLDVERGANIGMGSRIFDADQHPRDEDHPEERAPVRVGAYAWVSSDVTVLRGVEIGAHSVIGTRSLVTASIPPHTLAFGVPAAPRGTVGDRSKLADGNRS